MGRGTVRAMALSLHAGLFLGLAACGLVTAGAAGACVSDMDCGCGGAAICSAGACVPAFTLPVFPIAAPGASAYGTSVIAVVDHAGSFYTGCCDTEIIAFTGERGVRDD